MTQRPWHDMPATGSHRLHSPHRSLGVTVPLCSIPVSQGISVCLQLIGPKYALCLSLILVCLLIRYGQRYSYRPARPKVISSRRTRRKLFVCAFIHFHLLNRPSKWVHPSHCCICHRTFFLLNWILFQDFTHLQGLSYPVSRPVFLGGFFRDRRCSSTIATYLK